MDVLAPCLRDPVQFPYQNCQPQQRERSSHHTPFRSYRVEWLNLRHVRVAISSTCHYQKPAEVYLHLNGAQVPSLDYPFIAPLIEADHLNASPVGKVAGNCLWGECRIAWVSGCGDGLEYFVQREAKRYSLSRSMQGINWLFRQATVARPAGPAPTTLTGVLAPFADAKRSNDII
ncbi:hypothetical protein SLEP1_g23253 [Rubroshorea leprosula]|uniref:Uncharacterized protein n=1 Tax=Rubroshorea leprosula TaxID=152421 RepID=A0AAV5JH29_9ROSI|nr:hypothetical protein SLEP1_g23253 [Rubroshorea leprosula]